MFLLEILLLGFILIGLLLNTNQVCFSNNSSLCVVKLGKIGKKDITKTAIFAVHIHIIHHTNAIILYETMIRARNSHVIKFIIRLGSSNLAISETITVVQRISTNKRHPNKPFPPTYQPHIPLPPKEDHQAPEAQEGRAAYQATTHCKKSLST